MDRSPKQNIDKDIVALNNALDQIDLTDIYIEPFIPKKQNTHLLKYTWNIFKGRPYDRTQNKPQQIEKLKSYQAFSRTKMA